MLIPQLTFTRFIAAISIVIIHYGFAAIPFDGAGTRYYFSFLNSFVTYFFVLSGFILVVSNSKNGQLPERIEKKKFWKNRFARLYPLYLFAIVLLSVSMNAGGKFSDFFGLKIPVVYSIFLLQSWEPGMAMYVNYPSWSLSVEAFFYLAFPFLFQWLKPLVSWKLIGFVLIAWLANIGLYYYLFENENILKEFFYYFPPLHLISFVIGVCGGFLFVEKIEDLKRNKRLIQVLAFLLVSFFVFALYSNFKFVLYYHNGMLAPVYIVIIYCISLEEGIIKKLFSLKPFIYLGEISYGVYLLQCPVVYIVTTKLNLTKDFNPTTKFYFEVGLLILFSIICHELIEKPARKYIRNY